MFVDATGKLTLDEGEIMILFPGRSGILCADDIGGFVADYFHFEPTVFVGILSLEERLLFERLQGQRVPGRILGNQSPLSGKFRLLAGTLGAPGTVEHRCQLLQLLGPVVAELRSLDNGAGSSNAALDRVLGTLSALTDQELQSLSVDDLARRCSCSRRHLGRLVRRQFGLSIISFKTRLRLERAAALLQNPGTKVIEVAYQCGFSHVGAFSARFKERFGDTPARWRVKMLASREDGEPASDVSVSTGVCGRANHSSHPSGDGDRLQCVPASVS